MSLEIGDRVIARGQVGTVVRKWNDTRWVVRFDVEADVRPPPGQELVQTEAVVFIGEITKLDGTLP